MDQIVFTTGPEPEITLTSVAGDLRLTGWDQNEFFAEADERTLKAEQRNGAIAVACQSDCTVRVPRRARLKLLQIGGDARVKSVGGPLEIESVGGDLVLRQTLSAGVGHVGGDVSAKKIDGHLHIRSAGGDVSARALSGEFIAEQLRADLYLRDVDGAARARASGDVLLGLRFTPDHEYDFESSGDIVCRLPDGVSARFAIQSGGEISLEVPGAQVEGEPGRKVVTVDGGAASVSLRAAGDVSLISLSTRPEAMGGFGEHFGEEFGVMAEEFAAQIESQIEAQIESQMADFEKQLSERLGTVGIDLGGTGVKVEEIAARARRAAERASEIARRKAEAAQRRAEAKAEAAQRRADARAEAGRRRAERASRRGFLMNYNFEAPRPPKAPTPPRPPSPPAEAVSDEERLTILRMVEQKKISVADAEKLLAALEGKLKP